MPTSRDFKVVLTLDDRVSQGLDKVKGSVKSAEAQFRTLAIAGGAAFGAIAAGLTHAARAGARLEQTNIAFATMLGSAEKAKTLLAELSAFGLKTPFEITQLRESTKALLAYGVEGEKVIETLRLLGDISAGVGMDKLPQLILAFGQVKATTRLTGMELRQFSEAGVPLLGMLAEQMGVTTAQMQEMISEGKVSFGDVEQALRSMTQEGGKFHNLMHAQSQSLTGSWSNLKDTMTKASEEIGLKLVPVLTPLIQQLTVVVGWVSAWVQQNPELFIKLVMIAGALTGLVALVGTLGLVLPSVIVGFQMLTGVIALFATGVGLLFTPLGVLLAALGAIVAVFVYWDEIIDYVSDQMLLFAGTVSNAWERTKATTIAIWNTIKAYLFELFQGLLDKFTGVYDAITGKVRGIIDSVGAAISKVRELSKAAAGKVAGAIPFFAHGGVVTKPTLAVVGEAGPERIEPIGRGGSSAGGITIHINNPSVRHDGDIAAIRDEILSALSRMQELTQMGALA